MTSKKTNRARFVLVTTAHRGVFAGYLEKSENDGKILTLTQARCATYWATTRGFLELAEVGPNANSKIGAPAPRIRLHDVTSEADCTAVAIEAWSKA